MTLTSMQRLHQKIDVDFVSGCWIWNAARHRYGYGAAWYAGKVHRAHALMFRLYGGVIPDGLVLDHLCRVTSCVNPEHLEPVTQAENVRRQIAAVGTHNEKKTECPQGHAYAPVTRTRDGYRKRRCPTCARDQWQAWSERQRLVAA
jgi:hypothetical protein